MITQILGSYCPVKLYRLSPIIQDSQSLMTGCTPETDGWRYMYFVKLFQEDSVPSVEALAVEEHSVLATMMQGDEEVRLLFHSNIFIG